MVDEQVLERAYRERLDESIIAHLASVKDVGKEAAMDAYYGSRLAGMIEQGSNGIQYLDFKNLAQILIDTEPGRFDKAAEEDAAARKDV